LFLIILGVAVVIISEESGMAWALFRSSIATVWTAVSVIRKRVRD